MRSRVGQYIAQLKAENERARNSKKFQRLDGTRALMAPTIAPIATKFEVVSTNRRSLTDLCKVDNSLTAASELEVEMEIEAEADSSGNAMGTTMTSSTHSNGGTSSSGVNGCGSYDVSGTGPLRDTSGDTEYVNKLMNDNDRLKSYNDHLQNIVYEKSSEVVRLKRNIDVIRIELDSCKDKLKLCVSGNLDFRYNSSNNLYGRHRYLLPSHYMSNYNLSFGMISKATQTETQLPSIVFAENEQKIVMTPKRSQSMRAGKIYFTPNRKLSVRNNIQVAATTPNTQSVMLDYEERNVDDPCCSQLFERELSRWIYHKDREDMHCRTNSE